MQKSPQNTSEKMGEIVVEKCIMMRVLGLVSHFLHHATDKYLHFGLGRNLFGHVAHQGLAVDDILGFRLQQVVDGDILEIRLVFHGAHPLWVVFYFLDGQHLWDSWVSGRGDAVARQFHEIVFDAFLEGRVCDAPYMVVAFRVGHVFGFQERQAVSAKAVQYAVARCLHHAVVEAKAHQGGFGKHVARFVHLVAIGEPHHIIVVEHFLQNVERAYAGLELVVPAIVGG